MTEQERLLHAKIPCEQTGIEVRKSLCAICTGIHCGIDAYVKDGKLVKVEGSEDYPVNFGKLCVKGASTRGYVYREDRLKTPMKRIGARGEGKFQPITWEEAYRTIGERLNAIKRLDGPEAVAWVTGFTKWHRPWMHRLVHSFGSLNYATESSACYRSMVMAWQTVTGREYGCDLENSGLFVGWGCNAFHNAYPFGEALRQFHDAGGKIIIIDPRVTDTVNQLADLHLQLRPGTDGALALGLANYIICQGWADDAYIKAYIHGFEQFAAYAERFTLEETQRITGVPQELIRQAAEMYVTSGPVSTYQPASALSHHQNGYNNVRAVIALQAITGNLDREGGDLPVHETYLYTDCGFDMKAGEFVQSQRPAACKGRIGAGRFPVWDALADEFQSMDLARQITEGTPYPVKAMVAIGVNHRMFPQPHQQLEAYDKLDFIVAADLFETELCRHADIVLPCCTSLERSELKGYEGGFLTCTTPVIEPLYQSKHDAQILCELARYLDVDDSLLNAGYDATLRYLIHGTGLTLEELRQAPAPLEVPNQRPYTPGYYLEHGFETKTGKIELYSELIAGMDRPDLKPLPVYEDGFGEEKDPRYPFTLATGARLAHAVHSRFHGVAWARSLRPDPMVDIHPQDAQLLGVQEGDWVELFTPHGQVRVRTHLTAGQLRGDVDLYHGYAEADVNELIGRQYLDRYTGFPGYRQIRCGIRKAAVQ